MPHWEGLERAAQHDKPYPLGFYGMSLSYIGGVQVLSTNVCSSSFVADMEIKAYSIKSRHQTAIKSICLAGFLSVSSVVNQ